MAHRPEPYADLEPVLHAFALLSAVRPLVAAPAGTALGAIPLAEIRAYCLLFGTDDVEALVRLIRAMDDAALAHAAERRAAGIRHREPSEDEPWTSP